MSTDAILCSSQKATLYYNRIFEAYKERKPTDAVLCRQSSVETRLELILKVCVRFAVLYKTFNSVKKSGASVKYEVRLETTFHKKVKMEHPRDDIGPTLRFMNA